MLSPQNQHLFEVLYNKYKMFNECQLEKEMEKTLPSLQAESKSDLHRVSNISALAILANQLQLHPPFSLGNVDEIFEYFSTLDCFPYLDYMFG